MNCDTAKRKYKLVNCGTGTGVYRVVRISDDFNTGITVVNQSWSSSPDKWVARWKDFFSTQHERRFMTRARVYEFLEAK